MDERSYGKEDLLKVLPPEWPVDLRPDIRREILATGRKIVVLDDDPTGTQTVHSIPVLTEWDEASLFSELLDDPPLFYILTNSRSLPLAEARLLNEEIGRNLALAGKRAGREFVVVSRSDSTLRGHFPGEVEALAESLGGRFDAWIIVPFFLEGGRFTIDDIHYVDEKGVLVPAGQTQFARDAVFGYRASNLRRWVEEKTGGRSSSTEVVSISIEDLRRGGPERVAERLKPLRQETPCVVNAASYRDMEVFVRGLLDSEAQGGRFLYRTAASFVQVRAGIPPRPLLSREEMGLPQHGGGLVVIGSHIQKTTSQLHALLKVPGITGLELDVEKMLDEHSRAIELPRMARLVENDLNDSRDVVVYTTRRLHTAADPLSNLLIGHKVSEAVVSLLGMISATPRYLLAKGGITASDVATRGLHVKRAMVLGQILPGVPVWRLGAESRYPGLSYIVFPGNVGSDEALVDVVTALRKG
jgi:uncharacterized protein YgbK (DUF1537 family)